MGQNTQKNIARFRIKKGDEVIVIAGEAKGTTGRVLEVYPRKEKILIEGVNVVKRAYRKGDPRVPNGGIHDKTLPIHISNVMLADPADGEPTRVGIRYDEDKNGNRVRVRVAKGSGQDIKE